MIGELQEISIATEDYASCVTALQKLGFTEVETLPTAASNYSAMSLGKLTIGIYIGSQTDFCLRFVRPDLVSYLRALRHHHIRIDQAATADDEFHHATFIDPDGLPVELIEARTCLFSANNDTAISPLGRFAEVSVPSTQLDVSEQFWQTLGLNRDESTLWNESHVRLIGRGLSIGLHEHAAFPPGVSFECSDLKTRRAFLEALGCKFRASVPFTGQRGLTIATPLPIYVIERDSG